MARLTFHPGPYPHGCAAAYGRRMNDYWPAALPTITGPERCLIVTLDQQEPSEVTSPGQLFKLAITNRVSITCILDMGVDILIRHRRPSQTSH
jgi:hypothetical protein